jgi:hypothetical protein
MKKCPTCGSSYSDKSLNFCLTDGARLYDESDPDATVVMGAPPHPHTSTPIQSQQPTKPHFIYAGVGLVAVIVIGAVFLFNRSAAKPDVANQTQTMSPTVAPTAIPTPPPTIETREVLVPANEMWFDTGLTVKKGAQLNIRASGEWSDGGVPLRFWGPNGTGDPWPGTIVPAANLDALVGKIGTSKFLVGDSFSGRAPQSGNLQLSINDTPDSFSSNKGSMRVEVSYSSY